LVIDPDLGALQPPRNASKSRLDGSSANEVNDKDDDADHQQEVNERARHVECEKSEQPQD
jgi:hypothetical protein